ncbi:MAG TPA: Gfo/Idh/MocA family oxidoreductase [Bryobacteraceae bacterium]|nr:Gfo/Idh/MocA family oxidoreductase [Bryobacteraceae bacterium]
MAFHSRREFLGGATAALGANALAAASSSRVIGANDRINIGIIGVGGMGFSHVRLLKSHADNTKTIQLTAVSDIYTKRKQRAKDYIGLADNRVHHDYQELLARPDVDGVFIATPDHWHFRMAMDALDAGKDVYLQKPMTYTVEQARDLAAHVAKTGRVLQVGSQFASETVYFKAREMVRQGIIGTPLFAQATYSRNSFHGEWDYAIDPEGTPENIDWKRFLGSAPNLPFNQDRFFRWRKYWDYSGGISTDLLYHRLTPLLMVLGPQFPARVSANGGIFVHKDREVPDTFSTCVEYPKFQVVMSASTAASAPVRLTSPAIIGHEATMEFVGNTEILITPEKIFAKKFAENHGGPELRVYVEPRASMDQMHAENFFDCMRSREKPNLDAQFGYQLMAAIGLGVKAYREGAQMNFMPTKRDSYEGDGKNVDETQPA